MSCTPTTDQTAPELQEGFARLARTQGMSRQEAIARLSDELVTHFFAEGVTIDEFSDQPWTATAKQMDRTFGSLTQAHELHASSAEFNTLLQEHFQTTSGEVAGRIRDTIGLTTLSALTYCAFQMDTPTPLIMTDFVCQVDARELVAA
jgi:hypothetical protein